MNPPLIQTSQVLGSKEKLIRIVLQGFNEEVEINGDYFTNPMPAQPQLTNLEIADVLTYIRNSFGNKASAVSVAEVKAARTSDDVPAAKKPVTKPAVKKAPAKKAAPKAAAKKAAPAKKAVAAKKPAAKKAAAKKPAAKKPAKK